MRRTQDQTPRPVSDDDPTERIVLPNYPTEGFGERGGSDFDDDDLGDEP